MEAARSAGPMIMAAAIDNANPDLPVRAASVVGSTHDPHDRPARALVIDSAAWKADSGLTPGQVIDYLALMGDNVDNVPGVEKVGPKTAAKWLQEYGSLDALVGNDAAQAAAWMGSHNDALNGVPRELIESPQGLVTAVLYLDSMRAAS